MKEKLLLVVEMKEIFYLVKYGKLSLNFITHNK